MDSSVLFWVLKGPYASLLVLMGLKALDASLRILMGPYGSLKVLIPPHAFYRVLTGPYRFLCVLMRS